MAVSLRYRIQSLFIMGIKTCHFLLWLPYSPKDNPKFQVQVERSPLTPQLQSRTNTSRGRTPSAESFTLDRPYVPWASPYEWLQPFPCVGPHSPSHYGSLVAYAATVSFKPLQEALSATFVSILDGQ